MQQGVLTLYSSEVMHLPQPPTVGCGRKPGKMLVCKKQPQSLRAYADVGSAASGPLFRFFCVFLYELLDMSVEKSKR